MWTSVRTTTEAASRSASTPWAATSASASAAFSSVTTSTPASTAPAVSPARAQRSRPCPCGLGRPLQPPLRISILGASGSGPGALGVAGRAVLCLWCWVCRVSSQFAPSLHSCGRAAGVPGALCGGGLGPQMGRCHQRSHFVRSGLGAGGGQGEGGRSLWFPSPSGGSRCDQAELLVS